MPAFFKAKCADLTPFLGGDAAKDYPYPAALPTYTWKNSISAIEGQLFLVPIQRHLPTFPGYGGSFLPQIEAWETEIGAGYVPKDGDDSNRVLQALTHPQQRQWGFGFPPRGGAANTVGPSGVAVVAAPLYGGPNIWRHDSSGHLLRDWETQEYKAAAGYVRDLMASGVFPPDISTAQYGPGDHAERKYVVAINGYGNAWADLWRRGLLLSYGVQDQAYKLNDKGNPVPTQDGIARSALVPWQYIARRLEKRAGDQIKREYLQVMAAG